MCTDEAKLVFQKYEEMLNLLHKYCEHVYVKWTTQVDDDCQFNLEQPLILRDPKSNLIRVNFNKQVSMFSFSTDRGGI